MLFQKISSAFLSVTVMLSSLTINGFAADTEMNTAPSQGVISFPADNDSAEYILDLAEDTVDLTADMEGSVSVGAFTVTGGVIDTDFSYSDSILTVLTEVPLTISNTKTTATTEMIAVAKDVSANITLSGVNIDVSSTSAACAFKIADDSTGNVNITLEGTNVLQSGNGCAGLQKNGASGSLTINGTGSLSAVGGNFGAGIGGYQNAMVKNITINGGVISASGGYNGAGIGGGYYSIAVMPISTSAAYSASYSERAASGPNASGISINGGAVTATGGDNGAGIGGGRYGYAQNITISGGTVTAMGGVHGAGIGGGEYAGSSGIVISGGSVKVTSGSEASSIGGGYAAGDVTPTNGADNVYVLVIDNPTGDTIYIDGTPISHVAHGDEAKVYVFLTGTSHTVTQNGTSTDYIFDSLEGIFYTDESPGNGLDFTVSGGIYGKDYGFVNDILTVLTDKTLTISNKNDTVSTQKIYIAQNVSANITLSGVNIDVSSTRDACAFMIADNSTGNVNLTLEGTNFLTSGENCAGLQKNGTNGSLTIGGTGSLTATGGSGAAGIGGGSYGSGENITIIGGAVFATGGTNGAGIGSGCYGSADEITISGGSVSASGSLGGAGIGGGYYGNATNITISGGVVNAAGGESGTGIGGGCGCTATNIIISGGSVNASGFSINPTNGTADVYSIVIDNPTGGEILIDGRSFTPVSHFGEAKVYAYLTAENHIITVDGTVLNYCFNPLDYKFYQGNTIVDCLDFTISGGVYGEDFVFADNVITVLTAKPLIFSNKAADPSSQSIAIAQYVSANITLSDVNIDVSSTDDACAFRIADNSSGKVSITLSGTNFLTSGDNCAGLQKNGANGSLTISGSGSLTAKGGEYGAGIGGGYYGNTANITISSGTVTASVDSLGACIGGGYYGNATNITISGGTVTATRISTGAGIGGGFQGSASNIIISGGSVKSAAIDSVPSNGTDNVYCLSIDNPTGEVILIDGIPFTHTSHGEEKKVYIYLTGEDHTVTVNGTAQHYCYNPLDYKFYPGDTIEDYLDFTISGGTYGNDFSFADGVITVLTNTPLTFSNKAAEASSQRIVVAVDISADITLSGVNIDSSSKGYVSAFEIAKNSVGNVIIRLEGTNILKSGYNRAGIQKNGTNGSLNISGTGALTATGGSYGAGIGGGYNGSTSNITIKGGVVIAKGGTMGAGIGGGYNGSASNITISGGTVTATGGSGGAGIGGGYYGNATNITISGGTVTATRISTGAGIGGGYNGSASNIIISGGSVKALDRNGSESVGITPTNGANPAENVYLLVVENPDKNTIFVDEKEFTPITHNDENRIYVYLTGEDHTVKIGRTTKRFNFVDGAFEEKEPIPATVVGHGLTLSNLGVEFYMSLSDSITADENAYMLFTLPSGKTQRIYVKDAGSKVIDDEQCYVFPCYIAPAEISDEISAQVVSGHGETSNTYTFSLAEQCADMVNSGGNDSQTAFAKAILNYGTQAQLFFDHNTENPANASLAEGDRELAAISAYTLRTYRYTVVDNDDEIDFIGQVVQLNDNVAVKFYFSGNIDVSTCRVNGKRISSADIGKDTNGSYIIIRDILPEDLDEAYTITAGDVTVRNASVFSYLYIAIQAQRTDLYQIAYALYAYNKSAEAYFA